MTTHDWYKDYHNIELYWRQTELFKIETHRDNQPIFTLGSSTPFYVTTTTTSEMISRYYFKQGSELTVSTNTSGGLVAFKNWIFI